MSERISIIEKEGAKILFLDYTHLKGEEYVQAIYETKEFLLSQPKGYTFDATISDSSHSKMNEGVKKALKDLDVSLKELLGNDYLDKGEKDGSLSISIGISGLQKIIAGFMMKNVKFMNNKDEAIAYAIAYTKSRKN